MGPYLLIKCVYFREYSIKRGCFSAEEFEKHPRFKMMRALAAGQSGSFQLKNRKYGSLVFFRKASISRSRQS